MLWSNRVSSTIDYPGAMRTILHGINDNGVIFGGGVDANGSFLFVATDSAPEPATVATIGGALCMLGIRFGSAALQCGVDS